MKKIKITNLIIGIIFIIAGIITFIEGFNNHIHFLFSAMCVVFTIINYFDIKQPIY